MDIKNTMCRISELLPSEVNSICCAMPNGSDFDFHGDELFIGFSKYGFPGTWIGGLNPTIISYDEMMQLLTGKSMKFTKSDLIKLAENETVFVKRRDQTYRVYIGGVFNGEAWVSNDSYLDSLKHCDVDALDIMAAYVGDRYSALINQLKGVGLSKVWERTELTPAQKEMEVLQTKMNELQEQMKVAKAKLYLQGDWGE